MLELHWQMVERFTMKMVSSTSNGLNRQSSTKKAIHKDGIKKSPFRQKMIILAATTFRQIYHRTPRLLHPMVN